MGTPPQPPPPPYQPPPQPGAQQPGNPGMAVAGFVLGLIGLLLSWVPFLGLILAIIGLVLSIVGMRQANATGAPRGLAIAGLVCAILGTLVGLAITIATIAAVDEVSNQLDDITFTTTVNLVIGLRMLARRRIPRPSSSMSTKTRS